MLLIRVILYCVLFYSLLFSTSIEQNPDYSKIHRDNNTFSSYTIMSQVLYLMKPNPLQTSEVVLIGFKFRLNLGSLGHPQLSLTGLQ